MTNPFRAGAVTIALGLLSDPVAAQGPATPDLVGLWEAARTFGPAVQGTLLLVERDGRLSADIAGFAVPVGIRGGEYTFELPDHHGAFRGHRRGNEIRGFWVQPLTFNSGTKFATPLTLKRAGAAWRAEVKALEDRFSYYLPVTRAPDGTFATYLRNPERNDGVFTPVQSIVLDGDKVKLLGKEQRVVNEGRWAGSVLTFAFPNRGGNFDFRKVDAAVSSPFYPRGRPPATYHYTKPLQRDDGWPTASLEDVGISRPAIEAFIQKLIDTPMESVSSSQIHSVLIARHGKLVLEEYFHGHHRDQPHETRSASKSLVSVVVGAAMQAGIKVGPDTPVYQTMLGTPPADLEPSKRAMTLEHLLEMRGGHFCDDNNPNAPGAEDTMQDQDKERDWFRFILALPMDRTPGEKTIYCSIDAHLAGGVVAKAANEPYADLFDRLVARPLSFGRYHLFLSPTGETYNGGGHRILPRDFLKVAQLMVNDGLWDGRRILSKEWARQSTAALHDLSPRQQYGYLWNSVAYPYRDRKVHAFFAGGNGGQIFMGIPDLGLAIAFTGGNYADAALFIPQRRFVPEHILPAVQ